MSWRPKKWMLNVAIVALGLAIGLLLRGRLNDTAEARRGLSSASSASPSSTTSTTLGLQSRSYSPGDCVKWDQEAAAVARRTDVVPCDEPHLIEISGSTQAQAARYPTDADWYRLQDSLCGQQVTGLLGAPLDPHGRFKMGAIHPLEQAWDQGDRTVWCGAVRMTGQDDDVFDLFIGRARGQSQHMPYNVGDCVLTEQLAAVPCEGGAPYDSWYVGSVDLTGKVDQPPAQADTSGWNALVADGCRRHAEAFKAGITSWSFRPIHADSWAVGRRHVECFVDR